MEPQETKPGRQSEQPIAEEAVRWLEALKSGAHEDPRERRALAEWLKRSPRHVHYFLLSTTLDKSLESIDAGRSIDVEQLIAQGRHGVVELPNEGRRMPRQIGDRLPRRRAIRAWSAALVASVAVLTLSLIAGHLWHSRHQAPSFTTSVGEQRTIQLPDGSVAQLNTHSRIEVRFTEQARQVRLWDGEALFKVAPDGARPFRVLADESVIQALGTQFNVYRRPEGVAIAVLEGKVSLQTSPGNTAVLNAGEEAKVVHGAVHRIVGADLATAVAWRQRRLVFKVTPLDEIVAQFNRYNQAPKIRMEGLDGTARHYTGTFDADDPQSLALLLAQDTQLSVHASREEIVIREAR